MRVRIDTPAGTVDAELVLPDRPVRLGELPAAFFGLDDRITEAAARGARPSCRQGCAACCRQLVAVSPPEAFHLAELVESSPRKDEWTARFASARERLDSSPLGRALDAPSITEARALEIALAYPRLSLACPFLEDEQCAIYASRPAACREYLVTTPAEHCTMPSPARPVKRVPLPVRLSEALSRVAADVIGGKPAQIPLPRALAWARAHEDEARRTFDPAHLARRVLDALA